MMQFFRGAAKPLILITTIAFFIWLVYDLSGLGTGGGLLTTTSVGKVNGTTVDARQFQQAVQNAIDNRQRQTGAALTLDDIAQLRDEVWEQFIQDIIFRAEYEKYGILVSPEEVAEAIRYAPPREVVELAEFQTDGKFDAAKYQRWLASPGGQSQIPFLEARYREELQRGKLMRRVIADVYLSDAALWERYRDEKEMVTVGTLSIDPAVVIPDSEAPVTPSEVEAYYREHREDFRRNEAAFLSYVGIPRFTNAADTAAALTRAQALKAEIQAGAPFDEIARRESADSVSAREGGKLGELKRDAVDPAFAAAAMSLPLRRLSDPVLSGFGYHLIEVESRTADAFTARHILIPIEISGTHRDVLDARADSLEQLAGERLEGGALDTAASALGLTVRKVGPVIKGARVVTPDHGMVPDAGVWAFQARPGEHSAVIEAPNAYLVFRLDSLQREGVPSLDVVREEVARRVRSAKKREAAKALAGRLLSQAQGGTALSALGTGNGLAYQKIGPFARLTATFPDPALIGAAFSVEKGALAGPIVTDAGIYIFEGLERTPADSATFTRELATIRSQAQLAARQSRVRAYVTALREDAKIVDRRADLYRTSAQAETTAPTGL
ncbi:MAG: peptidyl-prolyl cis-trans isomerase [Gemmatimonadales bacterium]